MLDEVLRWLGAGDTAIRDMGPVLAIALAMVGAAAITQTLKFPLAELVPERWKSWAIRAVAIPVTWALLHWLGDLKTGVELVVAVVQPYAYSAAMTSITHKYPWLEATRAVGSVRPSDTAVQALAERRAQ